MAITRRLAANNYAQIHLFNLKTTRTHRKYTKNITSVYKKYYFKVETSTVNA